MKAYVPILLVFIFVAGFAVTNIVLSHVVGRRKDTRAKLMPYECGMESIFLLPWAVVFRDLIKIYSRSFVFFEMMIFVAVLLVGYIYVWKKGLFEWNRN